MTSLSPPLQAVVALFRGPLAGVRFADIDAAGLTSLATEVESAAAEVEQHEAKLVELRQSLAQRQEALLGLAQQALAYARIYAEGDDTLMAELADISLPRATKPRKATAKPAGSRADAASTIEATAIADAAPAAKADAEAASEPQETDESEEAEASSGAATSPAPTRRKVKRRLGRAPASRSDSA